MSADFFALTPITRTRALHGCLWCTDDIPLGSPCLRISGRCDGRMVQYYMHPDCKEALVRDPCSSESEECPYRHRQGMTCNETTDADEQENARRTHGRRHFEKESRDAG